MASTLRQTLASEHTTAMAEAARWAPSVHNTQPWRFSRLPDGIAVLLDRARVLPVLDPSGRLAVMSCAAAALNARIALGARRFSPQIELLPGPDEDVIATVRAGATVEESEADVRDAAAIPRRRTHRRMHGTHPVPASLLAAWQQAVAREGAQLEDVPGNRRRALASLLVRAVRAQAASPEHVEELEGWVRHWGTSAEPMVDGVPVDSLGPARFPVDSLVQEGMDVDELDPDAVLSDLSSQCVVVLRTAGDTRRDWVAAGIAMQRLLLAVHTAGYAAAYLDQATQVPAIRAAMGELLGPPWVPQLVLRLGSPLVTVPRTPRRPLEELWA